MSIFAGVPRPTVTFHQKPYAAISPSRPELNLKGKSVLITGGATGIGSEITKAFAQAGASTITLIARTEQPMIDIKKIVEGTYPETKVSIFQASVADTERVNAIVKDLASIDILVLNAAVMPTPTLALDTDPNEVMQTFQTNVVGPMSLMKAFVDLAPRSDGAERTILYVSSAGVYLPVPRTAMYNATKAAGTHMMASVHREYASKGIRSFSFHPAIAFTPLARDMLGLKEDSAPYDSLDLAGHFAVWLCSSEADFLKGKFLWANWDVTELMAKKDAIEASPGQLSIGLVADKVI